jgi:hypothetical protein
MEETEIQFNNLVEPFYPTLSHFAAGVCGNPVIGAILVAEIFTHKKTGEAYRSGVFGCAASSPSDEDN